MFLHLYVLTTCHCPIHLVIHFNVKAPSGIPKLNSRRNRFTRKLQTSVQVNFPNVIVGVLVSILICSIISGSQCSFSLPWLIAFSLPVVSFSNNHPKLSSIITPPPPTSCCPFGIVVLK